MSLPSEIERALEMQSGLGWENPFTANRVDGKLKPNDKKELKGWQAQKAFTYNQYLSKQQTGGKDAGRLNKKAAKAKI